MKKNCSKFAKVPWKKRMPAASVRDKTRQDKAPRAERPPARAKTALRHSDRHRRPAPHTLTLRLAPPPACARARLQDTAIHMIENLLQFSPAKRSAPRL